MLQKQRGSNKITKTSQKLRPTEKHTSCQWGLEETITSICPFVKGETQSSESLKCKGWDIYTSLSWEKTYLSCWRNLYVSGHQRSDTMFINQSKRSGRLRGCVHLLQRGTQKKPRGFSYSSLHRPVRVFRVV